MDQTPTHRARGQDAPQAADTLPQAEPPIEELASGVRRNEDISPSMQVLVVKLAQVALYGMAFFIVTCPRGSLIHNESLRVWFS